MTLEQELVEDELCEYSVRLSGCNVLLHQPDREIPYWISGKYYINRVGGLKITEGLWDLPKAYPRQKQLLKTSRDYTEPALEPSGTLDVLCYPVPARVCQS